MGLDEAGLWWGLCPLVPYGVPALTGHTPTVVRRLNELYKASVVSCQGLSLRLQRFLLDKQRLLGRIQNATAEQLIFSHAVQTVCRWVGWKSTPEAHPQQMGSSSGPQQLS